MRHAGEIGDDGLAADVLAQRQRQPTGVLLGRVRGENLAEIDGFTLFVRHLDTDDVAARYGGDTHGGDGQGAGDIVRQADDAGAADARCRFQFVQRDHGAGAIGNDAALHAVVAEHGFQPAGDEFQRFRGRADGAAGGGGGQQRQRREAPAAFDQRQRDLLGRRFRGLGLGDLGRALVQHRGEAVAGFRRRRFIRHVRFGFRHRQARDHAGRPGPQGRFGAFRRRLLRFLRMTGEQAR